MLRHLLRQNINSVVQYRNSTVSTYGRKAFLQNPTLPMPGASSDLFENQLNSVSAISIVSYRVTLLSNSSTKVE